MRMTMRIQSSGVARLVISGFGGRGASWEVDESMVD